MLESKGRKANERFLELPEDQSDQQKVFIVSCSLYNIKGENFEHLDFLRELETFGVQIEDLGILQSSDRIPPFFQLYLELASKEHALRLVNEESLSLFKFRLLDGKEKETAISRQKEEQFNTLVIQSKPNKHSLDKSKVLREFQVYGKVLFIKQVASDRIFLKMFTKAHATFAGEKLKNHKEFSISPLVNRGLAKLSLPPAPSNSTGSKLPDPKAARPKFVLNHVLSLTDPLKKYSSTTTALMKSDKLEDDSTQVTFGLNSLDGLYAKSFSEKQIINFEEILKSDEADKLEEEDIHDLKNILDM